MRKEKHIRADEKIRVAIDCIEGRNSQIEDAKEVDVKPDMIENYIEYFNHK